MMLAARLCRVPLVTLVNTSRQPLQSVLARPSNLTALVTRNASSQAKPKFGFKRRSMMESIKSVTHAPAGDTAFGLGRGLVAGASVIGLGALCFYGLGMSSEVGAVDRSVMWPQVVKDRIRDTYMYFGGSIAATAATAAAVFKNPRVMSMMMKNSWLAIGATFAVMIGSGMLCRSIPYQEGFGAKQMAWLLHSCIMGAVVAPITLLGGPILVRAAWYTAGVVGGLSTLAMCAPSEKFLNMGGPLAIGLGVVFASSIGGMFLPPSTALGAGLYSISIYGGLVLFGMFLLYDTQKIIKRAETHPTYATRPYDPINQSIGIYLDTLNIFIRIATILGGGGNRRK